MHLRTLLTLLLLPLPLGAAPPTLTHLFPAGGQRGQKITVTAGGVFSSWPVQAWCESKRIAFEPGKESGQFHVAIAPDTVPGLYWVRLFNTEGASELRPFLVSNLAEVLEQEPNDDFKKPHLMPSSTVIVSGKLAKPGDVDGFGLKLTKGQTLVASLEAYRHLRSPMDGVLQVVSADGFVLAQNDDYHEMDPQIVFAVPRDGTFIVRVFAFPSVPDSSIRFAGGDKFLYRLTMTTGPYADHADPLAVTRSESKPVGIVGWNIPKEAASALPEPGGSGAATMFHPLLANAVSVRIEPHPITLRRRPGERTQPQEIAMPTTITGVLDVPSAVDVYQFAAKKGQKLRFEAEARSLDFPLDPVLRLLDAKGQLLTESRAGKLNTDPVLTSTASEDGTYRLEVRDLHGAGGPRYVYRLRALSADSDFNLTVAADRFTLTVGKPLSIPVTIDRPGAASQDLTFTVEGLPAGVALKSDAGKGKAVTLSLTASQPAPPGPIRILAHAKDGASRSATAKGAEAGWTSDRLWLTTSPAAK